MPTRMRQTFTALSLMFLLLSALPLYQALSQPDDIWWTPHALKVPLSETRDRVEIYVRGRPLATLVRSGDLRVLENGRTSALAPGDIGLRFNNRDKVRAEQLPMLLGYAAMCGLSAGVLLFVASGRLAWRGER